MGRASREVGTCGLEGRVVRVGGAWGSPPASPPASLSLWVPQFTPAARGWLVRECLQTKAPESKASV